MVREGLWAVWSEGEAVHFGGGCVGELEMGVINSVHCLWEKKGERGANVGQANEPLLRGSIGAHAVTVESVFARSICLSFEGEFWNPGGRGEA